MDDIKDTMDDVKDTNIDVIDWGHHRWVAIQDAKDAIQDTEVAI